MINKVTLVIFLFFSLFTVSSFSFSLSLDDYLKYDNSYSLNPEIKVEREDQNYTAYKVYYSSIRNKRVPAIYIVPKGVAKCPAVIFIHGAQGKKEDIFGSASYSAEKGYCLLSIDMPYHGERKVEGKFIYSQWPYHVRNGFEQGIIDLMRGVDFLNTQEIVDKNRIGLLGGSMGGILGGVFYAVDKRISSAVLVVGGGDWGYLVNSSIVSEYLGIKGKVRAEDMRRASAPCDPMNYVMNVSPRPILMLNAIHDILVPPYSNKMLFSTFKPPKKIIWFKSDHGIDEEIAKVIVFKWFNDTLGKTVEPFSLVECYNCGKPPTSEIQVKYPYIKETSSKEYFEVDKNFPLGEKWSEEENLKKLKFTNMDEEEKEAIIYSSAKPENGFYLVESPDKKEIVNSLKEKGFGVIYFNDDFHSSLSQLISYPYYLRETVRKRVRDFIFAIRLVKEKYGNSIPFYYLGEEEGNAVGSALSMLVDFKKLIAGKDTSLIGLCPCKVDSLKNVMEPFRENNSQNANIVCYKNENFNGYFSSPMIEECIKKSDRKSYSDLF